MDDTHAVQRISPGTLARAIPGSSTRWWTRRMPLLRSLGLIRKVGRFHFGRVADISAALMRGDLDEAPGREVG